jgi:hypothetical protein
MQNDHLEGTYKWPEEPYKPTQRDYFAAAALTGLLANSYTIEGLSRSILNKAEVIRSYTTACIEHADDIIKRLNETK